MNIPDILPIKRIEDYLTHYVGRSCDGRQFFGRETAWVYFSPKKFAGDPDFLKSRGEYVVLHTFDKDGSYLTTRHWFAGTSAESIQQEKIDMLEKWINELGEWQFEDISVKPFEVNIDGFLFGLVANEEGDAVNLRPSPTIAFYEPWDGEYYT